MKIWPRNSNSRSFRWYCRKSVLPCLFISILILCCPFQNAFGTDLHLLAGAGLRGPTDTVIKKFHQETGIHVLVEYGGSGKLLARYRVSGKGDLFMPGDYFYIECLRKEKKIKSATPFLFHTPVIAFNKQKKLDIQSVKDLARPGLRLALGDPKAMALGRTADEILKNSGYEADILKNLTVYGATVKQLALYVSQGSVDASIIARADAFQLKDTIEFIPIPGNLFTPSRIGIALLSSSGNPEGAAMFQQYITRTDIIKIFTDAGFLSENK